jgi:glycosyltransferase involved in cell wall biosynthesis
VLKDNSRVRFVLLGDGYLRERYMNETRACGNVQWLGSVPREAVHAVLRQCDILYFSTRASEVWHSGFSLNKVSDYMLAAKPIIASFSGHRSMLNEAGCGEFVPAGDASALVSALMRFSEMSHEKLEDMGLAGREWLLNNRTWSQISEHYLNCIDRLH